MGSIPPHLWTDVACWETCHDFLPRCTMCGIRLCLRQLALEKLLFDPKALMCE